MNISKLSRPADNPVKNPINDRPYDWLFCDRFIKQSTPTFILELILNIIKASQAIDIKSKTYDAETLI